MALLRVVISDEVEKVLREVVPYKKGALGKYVEEAIVLKLKQDGKWRGD